MWLYTVELEIFVFNEIKLLSMKKVFVFLFLSSLFLCNCTNNGSTSNSSSSVTINDEKNNEFVFDGITKSLSECLFYPYESSEINIKINDREIPIHGTYYDLMFYSSSVSYDEESDEFKGSGAWIVISLVTEKDDFYAGKYKTKSEYTLLEPYMVEDVEFGLTGNPDDDGYDIAFDDVEGYLVANEDGSFSFDFDFIADSGNKNLKGFFRNK